jgi:hypothetical protein
MGEKCERCGADIPGHYEENGAGVCFDRQNGNRYIMVMCEKCADTLGEIILAFVGLEGDDDR